MATRRSTRCMRSFRSMHESSETTQRLQGACDRGFRGGCNARPSLGGIERRPAENNQKEFGQVSEAANGIFGEPGRSLDAIFIGDSEAYSSFSPLQMWEEHGFTSYVSATSGQRLTYGYRLLEKALRSQKPKVVVFETNSIYSPIKPDDAVLSLFQNKLPVFEYHDRWKSLDAQDFLGKPSATWSDPLKGFVVNRGVNPADAVNHMTPSSEALPVDVANRQYITAMVEACRANGATPVFVSTPSTVNWNTAKHNGMSELARELGVDYYDLNEGPDKVPIDWSTDTHDKGDHLNFDGATKVSAYMGKLLSEKYGLPDHRSDSAFDRWNASLERYKQQIAS